MKPANVFQLEMTAGLASVRSLFMKVGFALLLGLPFVFITMPLEVRIRGLTILVIFPSFFGAAVTLVRRRSEGHLRRLRLLPIPRWILLGDILLYGAVMDCLQMGPVLILLAIACAIFFGTVLLLNLLGMLLGFVMKSNPEVHLAAALAAGTIAFASGLLPAPPRVQWLIERRGSWNPVFHLSCALGRLEQGGEARGGILVVASCAFAGIILILFLLRAPAPEGKS